MATYEYNDKIKFMLPAGFILEREENDEGEEVVKILAGEYEDDDGDTCYSFQCTITELEYDPDDIDDDITSENLFEKVIEAYRATGVEIEVELVGDRPCAGNVDPQAQQDLEALAEKSSLDITGGAAVYSSCSTDCNIPLSLGIPAVCLGAVVGKGAHTRGEVLYLQSLLPGSRLCMEFLSNYFA